MGSTALLSERISRQSPLSLCRVYSPVRNPHYTTVGKLRFQMNLVETIHEAAPANVIATSVLHRNRVSEISPLPVAISNTQRAEHAKS